MLIGILFEQPILFLLIALALIVSISIHEFAHAYVATKLGDPTAASMGRVTLNPVAHLDPLGTALLLFAGFGWGRPVPFNPYYLKHPRRDSAIISLAGPLSNFSLALVLVGVVHLLRSFSSEPILTIIGGFTYLVIYYNLILGFFNLIPIHPLDGFKVVNGLLPENLSYQWMQMAPYGIFLLLLLILTNSTGKILNFFLTFVLNFFGLSAF
jgi:Zn-dependent protease